nr:hypothetical protein CFP56_03755 [Quercus suber]
MKLDETECIRGRRGHIPGPALDGISRFWGGVALEASITRNTTKLLSPTGCPCRPTRDVRYFSRPVSKFIKTS